jgi:hypothetical protein
MTDIALGDPTFVEVTVRRAAAGDDAACARLVEEHFGPMVRAAFVVTGDPETASGPDAGASLARGNRCQRGAPAREPPATTHRGGDRGALGLGC